MLNGLIAQSVEQLTLNQLVEGSNPSEPIKSIHFSGCFLFSKLFFVLLLIKHMKILFNTQTYPTFRGKTSHITTEDLKRLIESGKTVREIKAELGIATDTYYKLLRERGISYRMQKEPQNPAGVSKVQIETLLKNGITVPKICEMFKITANAYYKLAERLGVKHPKKALAERAAAITEQQLKKCISDRLSVKQICETLQITPGIYYDLLGKFNIQTAKKASFKHNSSITKEQLQRLIDSGMSYKEILEELQISPDGYNTLISKFGIVSAMKQAKEHISAITKEKLLELIESGKSVKEICMELDIKERTYSRLLDKFGISTQKRETKRKLNAITAKELQELVDNGLSIEEICKNLGIGKWNFYKLLKRLNIQYNYQHHHGEIIIPVERLQAVSTSGRTTKEIADELGISQNTYNEKAKVAKINTVLREAIYRISEISKEEMQEAINSGMTVNEICSKFKITHANYSALIRKYNLVTPQRESTSRISQISKAQILEMKKSGKSVSEICEALNISENSYRRILKAGSANS